MRLVDIQGRRFSKVLCGTNQIYGRSHFSDARGKEYTARFSDAYIAELLRYCISQGVNAIESCANERIWGIISSLRAEHPLRFIGTTRLDETSVAMKSLHQKLDFLLEVKADICVIHAQFVERPGTEETVHGLQTLVDRIHEQGLLAGVSAHRVSTVEMCERGNYGVDAYLFPLNMTGYVYPGYEGAETVRERTQLVQQTEKPFIIMKSLASGRIPPHEGLPFVLEQIKENDLITLGLGSLAEAEESLALVAQYLDGAL